MSYPSPAPPSIPRPLRQPARFNARGPVLFLCLILSFALLGSAALATTGPVSGTHVQLAPLSKKALAKNQPLAAIVDTDHGPAVVWTEDGRRSSEVTFTQIEPGLDSLAAYRLALDTESGLAALHLERTRKGFKLVARDQGLGVYSRVLDSDGLTIGGSEFLGHSNQELDVTEWDFEFAKSLEEMNATDAAFIANDLGHYLAWVHQDAGLLGQTVFAESEMLGSTTIIEPAAACPRDVSLIESGDSALIVYLRGCGDDASVVVREYNNGTTSGMGIPVGVDRVDQLARTMELEDGWAVLFSRVDVGQTVWYARRFDANSMPRGREIRLADHAGSMVPAVSYHDDAFYVVQTIAAGAQGRGLYVSRLPD